MSIRLPQGQEKVRVVRAMFDSIASTYDKTNKVMTFGLDTIWRKRTMYRLALPANSLVGDLACGTGDYCRLLEAAGHRAIGVDMSLGMLIAARTDAPLLQGDALALPFGDGSLDGITCGFALRNLDDLAAFFVEIARVTRPGGRVLLLDAYRPSFWPLRVGHGIYFDHIVPRIGALISSNSEAYRYLPASLGYLPPIGKIFEDMSAAGFKAIQRSTYMGGAVHLFTATKI